MLVLFLLYILNFKWSHAVFLEKYTAYRILQTVLVIAVLLNLLDSLISGIILSCYVFDFLGIDWLFLETNTPFSQRLLEFGATLCTFRIARE